MNVFITEDFQNSWIFQDEKKIKWWIDLHFLADEDGIINLSLADLSRRWKTDRATVSRFLARLSEKPLCNTLVQHFVQQITISRTTSYKGTCNTSCNTLVQQQKESPLSSPSLSSPTPPSITPPIIPQEKNSERVACAYTREEDFSLQVGVVATIERYAEQYKTEGMWSDVAMINHIKIEQVKEIFAEFVSIQKHNANEYTNYSDFKSHFMNFVRQRAKAIWADKSQQQQQPRKVISGKDIFDVYK
jgi:hypothetical protein